MTSNNNQNVTNSQFNEFKTQIKDMYVEFRASMLEALHGRDTGKRQIEEDLDPRWEEH